MKLSIALFFATTLIVSAQTIEVPHKLQFADMTLIIRDDARREIQKDVDAFTRYPKSFNTKVERARTFFPLIEKIFAEENVPEDFKFLAIQESALISDAVSTSNAVGYWQFKDFTAMEMGLRVDREVDERMNIVASTRAAARYIKKNNVFFDNWLFALQAYQMGAGGVLRSEKQNKSGAKEMEITSGTYWYVKKYLAHKIAYEGFTKGNPEIQVLTYPTITDKRTLIDIAREAKLEEAQVLEYNKWLKASRIPEDRTYSVILPVKGDPSGIKLPEAVASNTTVGLDEKSVKSGSIKSPQSRIKINGITALRAQDKETPSAFASRANVELSSFLKWNDISISDKLTGGEYYLLGKKRSRAQSSYHKVKDGESLWMISQKYGIQMKKLRKYNRLHSDSEIKPGMTLWLSTTRPKDGSKSVENGPTIEVNESDTFAWDVTPKAEETASAKVEQPVIDPIIETTATDVRDTLTTADTRSDTVTANNASGNVIELPADSVSAGTPIIQVRENPDEHVVQVKETLYGIARQYGVGVMDLVNWNSLDLQQGIKPGQVLKVKAPVEAKAEPPASEPASDIVHEVRASDTVYSIARKYGVTIKELMAWNNKRDFNLSVGEKLRIMKRN